MTAPTPLAGLRLIEFIHMVMGPTVGHILAGLGAEVIRIEPIGGWCSPRSACWSQARWHPRLSSCAAADRPDTRIWPRCWR